MRNGRLSVMVLLGLSLVACGDRSSPAPSPAPSAVLEPLALNASGALDPGYGQGGVGTTSGHRTRLNSFAVQTDGQALLFKYSAHAGHTISELVRFSADGQADLNFGDGGALFFPEAQGVVTLICPRGANRYNDWGADCDDPQRPEVVLAASGTGQLTLRRYLPSGQPDPGFGQEGVAVTSVALSEVVAVRVQADGKTVVAGGNAVARFTRGGQPDASFGTGGVATLSLPAGSVITDMVLDDAEHPLVLNNVDLEATPATRVLRLTTAGRPDAGYGTSGQVSLTFGPGGMGTSLLTLNTGRLLVGGTGGLWRLLPSGAPDLAFGVAGHATVPGTDFLITDLAQDGQNRPVASVETAARFRPLFQGNLARFRPDGTLDSGFASGGVSSVNLCPSCAQSGGLASFDGVAALRSGRLLGLGTSGHGDHLLVARMFP